MKTILIGTYYQVLTFLRIRKALFFAFFFPCFVYIVFSMIWGSDNEDYQRFLLTGILIMTTASDALFTIGGIIDDYYRNGLMKFFKVTRYTLAKHIISLIISRVIIVLFSSALVFSLALAIGQLHFSFRDVAFILFGISSAFIIFALTGIIVAEIIKEHSSNSGILNMIFYGVIFLSNTFYPLTDLNPTFNVIVLFNPITPSLELARGVIHPVPLIAWIAALTLFHTVFSINSHIKR